MTKRLTDGQIQNLIREIEFQPLKITVNKRRGKAMESGSGESALLDVRWKNNSQKFIAEIVRQATPKQIETGMLRLENRARQMSSSEDGKNHLYPILVAPYLSERTLQLLAEAEISGIDLSGNGVVVIPEKLFVYRAGAKNKFISTAPIKNVFRGTSSLAARVFFAKPEYENVSEVLDEIIMRGGKTTFSTVSKVLKALEEELLISKSEKIRLLDAKKLLDLLIKNYRRPDVRRKLSVKCADLGLALKQLSENAEGKKILYARNYPEKYAALAEGVSAVKIYSESIKELLNGVEFTETSRFPDLELLETDEPTVYFDRRQDKNFYLMSPLQTFLQLANEGKREQEGANSMIKGLLEFKY